MTDALIVRLSGEINLKDMFNNEYVLPLRSGGKKGYSTFRKKNNQKKKPKQIKDTHTKITPNLSIVTDYFSFPSFHQTTENRYVWNLPKIKPMSELSVCATCFRDRYW